MNTKEKWKLMGKIVIVNEIVYSEYQDEMKPTISLHFKKPEKTGFRKKTIIHEKLENPRPGWITGFTVLYEGRLEIEYDQAMLTNRKPFKVAKVNFTPFENPMFVPLDGFSLNTDKFTFPYNTTWNLDEMENMSRYMVNESNVLNWERDEKGRWIKGDKWE